MNVIRGMKHKAVVWSDEVYEVLGDGIRVLVASIEGVLRVVDTETGCFTIVHPTHRLMQ